MRASFHRQSGVLKAEIARCVQERRARRRGLLRLCLSSLLALPIAARALEAAREPWVSGEVASDPVTGAALLGFDPVAYFLDRRAVPGRADRQARYGGRVWYFASNANRGAFEANPQAFLPAFAGFDPVAIAAGFAVSGSPELFVIADNRVFLFRQPESRAAFLADPEIRAAAQRLWPQVRLNLAP